MALRILLFISICFGGYLIANGLIPEVSAAAQRAVRARAGKKPNLTSVLTDRVAVRILPYISLEDAKKQKLAHSLNALQLPDTPELFTAKAWGKGVVYALTILILSPVLVLAVEVLVPGIVSPLAILQISLVIALVLLFAGQRASLREIDKKIVSRREAIEWELAQFAETILQSLKITHSPIRILESYVKICGANLRPEIVRTINEMNTGNHERALTNLAARINSGAFTQIASGLIGLIRGDDQSAYFRILANDFSRLQSELIKRTLLKRPAKLFINNALLLMGMFLMFIVAIGSYLMDTGAGLF